VPTITAIERQKRRRRVDVHIDGAYAFSIGLELAVERKLAVVGEIGAEQRRELEREDQRRGALAAALRLLAAQPRSEKELRDRLRRRAFGREAVDAAVERMRELGYLNDAAFARFFVEARQAATPRSRRALSFELTRKGVGRELAAEAVVELSDEDAAYDAAQRRLRALRGLDKQAFTRRLGAFLTSRAFGYGVARATIERCWAETQAEADVSLT
jgi:regulatory protein